MDPDPEDPELVKQFTYDNIVYEYEEGSAECTLVKALDPPSEIDIPEKAIADGKEFTVTRIGESAFKGTNVVKVSMPNTIREIGNYAFSHSGLKEILLSENITEISDDMLSNTNLTSVKIPDSVTKIGNGAFAECHSLTALEIPESVTAIGEFAFSGSALYEMTIPNSVTDIGRYISTNCNNLYNIVIGESVKDMARAFNGCPASDVTVLATEPPAAYQAFSGSDRRIYVKDESLEAYKNNEEWREMGEILPIPSPVEHPCLKCSREKNKTNEMQLKYRFPVPLEAGNYKLKLRLMASAQTSCSFTVMYDDHISKDYIKFGQTIITTWRDAEISFTTQKPVKSINMVPSSSFYGDVYVDDVSVIKVGNNSVNYVSNGDFSDQNYKGWVAEYGKLSIVTDPTIEPTGVTEVIGSHAQVDVYNAQGVLIKRQVDMSSATEGLPSGIYIIGNKKVVVE